MGDSLAFAASSASSTMGSSAMRFAPDFSSDVGRKKFGFSHEEIDDSSAYFEGQFKLFQRCGEGTLHSPDTGSKYVGQFQNDQFHGEGDQTWSDGSKYKGQWKTGQKKWLWRVHQLRPPDLQWPVGGKQAARPGCAGVRERG